LSGAVTRPEVSQSKAAPLDSR